MRGEQRSLGGSLADLREQNLARVMRAMLPPRPRTRDTIERCTGMRPSSMTRLVDDLRERGLVSDGEPVQLSTRGRPTRPLLLSRERWALLGLILDRSEIIAVLGYLDLGVIEQRHFPLVPDGSSAYLDRLAEVLAWAAAEAAARGLRILAIEAASPGAVNRATGEVVRAEPNLWEHLDLVRPIQERVATLQNGVHRTVAVHVDRVANYAMLGRLKADPSWMPLEHGERPHSAIYFGGRYALTGGLYDGDVYHGATGLAGEYGHLTVDAGGEQCWCGRRGCLETKIGLATLHRRAFGTNVSITEVAAVGSQLIADIRAEHRSGSIRMDAILRDGGHWLAAAVDKIASVANPSHVVFDGYLAQLGDPLIAAARRRLAANARLPAIAAVTPLTTDGDPFALSLGTLYMGLATVASAPEIAEHGLPAEG